MRLSAGHRPSPVEAVCAAALAVHATPQPACGEFVRNEWLTERAIVILHKDGGVDQGCPVSVPAVTPSHEAMTAGGYGLPILEL